MINFAQNFRKMSKLIHMNNEYAEWVKSLSQRFRQSQIKASVKVNSEMLRFYWSLGRDIVENSMDNKYGSGFFNNLSNDLKDSLPGVKGFSPRNLAYMKSFYVLYSPLISQQPQEAGGNEFLQQVVAKFKTLDSGRDKLPQVADNSSDSQILQQVVAKLAESIFSIPWGHHTLIINRCMNQPEKALFFTQKTIENGWSRNVLLNFLDTDLYERQGKAITNFTKTLPSPLSDLAQELASNAYSRRQETQADETAVQFCVQNGVDPYAMYHALNVLIQLSGQTAQQGKLQELLSTHPDTYKRAAHVKQMCEAAGYSMTTSTPKTQNTSTGSGTTNTSGGGGKLKAGKKK